MSEPINIRLLGPGTRMVLDDGATAASGLGASLKVQLG